MLDQIAAHLNASPKNIIVVASNERGLIFSAKHLDSMKQEGSGIRIKRGRSSFYIFTSQIRFAHWS